MITLLTSEQMRAAEQFTIRQKGISPIDLMETAARAFVDELMERYPSHTPGISVYCGTGNNGGDGLAIARLLQQAGYTNVAVKLARFSDKQTPDFNTNLARLHELNIPVTELFGDDFPTETAAVVIDALLGSGINRPLSGRWRQLVDHINAVAVPVISVDMPTGLFSEGPMPADAVSVHSELTICFQRPRINFFFPDTGEYAGDIVCKDIGLDQQFLHEAASDFQLVTVDDIRKMLKPRTPFSHKGTFGHTLVLAGKPETMGAAILCAGASLYAGAGLTTAAVPREGLSALNSAYPEVMAVVRDNEMPETRKFDAVVAGPGLGTGSDIVAMIEDLLQSDRRLVFDADALTILSERPDLWKWIAAGTVITPHMKEFDRLFGEHRSWWERLQTAKTKAAEHSIVIVLKNRYTFTCLPSGKVCINPTGGPAMATGGSGDVLAGIIGALLAQGHSPENACVAGVYLHGYCGEQPGRQVIPAAELIKSLPAAHWKLAH